MKETPGAQGVPVADSFFLAPDEAMGVSVFGVAV